MTRRRIVVALTTCDSEQFLGPQLESIAQQTRLPDAVVVGDDLSTDRTLAILDDFARRMPFPVRVLRHESRVGPIRNSETVLAKCADDADVVAVADHDDVWMPEKLAVVEKVFSEADAPILWFSDADLIDGAGASLPGRLFDMVHLGSGDRDLLRTGGGLRRLVHGETVTNPTIAIDAALIPLAVPFPEDKVLGSRAFQQDGWLAVLGRLRGAIRVDDRALISYRRHARSVSHQERMESARTGGAADRKSDLAREQRRARLVADRVRSRDAPWAPDAREEILALDRFLSARVERRLGPRLGGVLREWSTGSYRRFARGARTALYDLADPFRRVS